jgi:hypothetical protein
MQAFPLKISKILYVLRLWKHTCIFFSITVFRLIFSKEMYCRDLGLALWIPRTKGAPYPWVTMRLSWDFSSVTTISQYTRNSKICASNTAELKGKQYASWPAPANSQYGKISTASSLAWLSHLTPWPSPVRFTTLFFFTLPGFMLFCIDLKG